MTANEVMEPCSDGNCILRDRSKPRGMGTNGGCEHLRLPPVEMRVLVRSMAMELDWMRAELGAFRAAQKEQEAEYDAVLARCENPPEPTPLLVKLMSEAKNKPSPPVIATCEVCPHGNAAEGRQLYCFHPSASRETDGNPRMVKRAVPPSWCPWRGQP